MWYFIKKVFVCQFMEQYINYNANRVTIFAIASVYSKSGEIDRKTR